MICYYSMITCCEAISKLTQFLEIYYRGILSFNASFFLLLAYIIYFFHVVRIYRIAHTDGYKLRKRLKDETKRNGKCKIYSDMVFQCFIQCVKK